MNRDGVRLAGRCFCGVIEAWMMRDPDEHMECWNLRWCKKCGEVAPHAANCVFCHREQARRWAEKQRQANSEHYIKSKADKKRKYHADPLYAETLRRRIRRQYRLRRQRVAA